MTEKKPVKKATKEAKPFVTTEHISTRVLIAEHLGEILGAQIGMLVVICATLAAVFHVLDANALSVILGGFAGGAAGFGAGKVSSSK